MQNGVTWDRLKTFGDTQCATDNCLHSARWFMEAGSVGSYFCSLCKDAIIDAELRRAAVDVVAYDCSDCDDDYQQAVNRLRLALEQ